MEKKCICPQCGNNLIYWVERVIETKQKINPYTGKIYKTKTKEFAPENTGNEGFECAVCGWVYNVISESGVGSGDWHKEASKLIDIINEVNK